MNRDWWDGIDKDAAARARAKAREKILRDQVKAIRDRSLIEEDNYPPSFEFFEDKTAETAILCANVLLDSWHLFEGEIQALLGEARDLRDIEF